MHSISICIGSACHLKGSYSVLETFKNLIEKHNLQATVELEGNFCQNMCTQGVVVKIDDQVILNVDKDNAERIFLEHIKPS